jgi:glycosyltransferase involved in cell wall biosynthesis
MDFQGIEENTMSLKIGILTAYDPKVKLTGQGIGHLIVHLVKGFNENGVTPLIVAPRWHRKMLQDFVEDFDISEKTNIISSPGNQPLLISLYDYLSNKRTQPNKYRASFSKIISSIEEFAKKLLFRTLAVNSYWEFSLLLILAIPLTIIFLPLLILYKLIIFIFKAARIYLRKIPFFEKIKYYVSVTPKSLRNESLIAGTMNEARKKEFSQLIKLINKSDVDVWYIPAPFWPLATEIKQKKLLAVPDLVHYEFPHYYSQEDLIETRNATIKANIQAAEHVVCYSNHVKQNHIVNSGFAVTEKVSVIPHGCVSLCQSKYDKTDCNNTAEELSQWVNEKFESDEYLRNIDLGACKYIVYTSQNRAHKNIKQLIITYERLLRQKHINIKLILTAQYPDSLPSLIRSLNLTRDVIFIDSIPTQKLALLNKFAEISVNPTLFEGGFPFTFSEAYSVGTPSVMSDIPVTREMVPLKLAEKMLFNPYDPEDMLEKIAWGLANKEELYELQQELYKKIEQRTWKKVAKEYMDTMEAIIGKDYHP